MSLKVMLERGREETAGVNTRGVVVADLHTGDLGLMVHPLTSLKVMLQWASDGAAAVNTLGAVATELDTGG